MGLFSRFVEVGRLAVVTYGADLWKPAVIVDIVDLNRVIIDGPTSGVKRQVITIKRLSLTDFVLKDVKRGCSSHKLTAALAADDVIAEWKETSAAKKIATSLAKKGLNDFERFQVQRAKTWVAKTARAM